MAVKLLRPHWMRILSALILATLTLSAHSQAGGDGSAPRTPFRQSSTYPFIFRPECYLATRGPTPMRFAAAPPACPHREAPALTPAAKGLPKQEPPAAEKQSPAPATTPGFPAAPEPAFPVPLDAQPPKRDTHDFSKVPDEVLEYFKNADGRPLRRDYLFDPIFQPALPHDLPKSKAIYQQK